MVKQVTDEYTELYHYTTSEGLLGIITDQYLRATNISYLNDSEERIRYLEHRMPLIVDKAVKLVVGNLMKESRTASEVMENGGPEKVTHELTETFKKHISASTIQFEVPYVVSFCGAKYPSVTRDGLLSQWRGYGQDGGYAIVFDTKRLNDLIEQENKKYLYTGIRWGDVNYHDEKNSEATELEEVREFEEVIHDSLVKFMKTNERQALESLYEPISYLSCITKHDGFHEENEVRIVVTTGTDDFVKEVRGLGDARPDKFIHHYSRGGMLVPYIRLFEGMDSGLRGKLPIKSVIVGPHPDKIKRKQSVELLLKQHDIDAEVTVSSIPYIPR